MDISKNARVNISQSYYHIFNRFVDGQSFFSKKENVELFFDIFYKTADKFNVDIIILYAMPNHFHSIIYLNESNLSEFLHRYATLFTHKLNKLLHRKGHVFQSRHKSQIVDKEEYLLNLIKYIYSNALRSGIVSRVEHYKWSNIEEVLNLSQHEDKHWDYVYGLFSHNWNEAKKLFCEWLNKLDSLEINKIEGRFLMHKVEKTEVLKKINRRKTRCQNRVKYRRQTDKKNIKVSIRKIKKELSDLKIERIKDIWKNEKSALNHINWYILHEIYNYSYRKIADEFRISYLSRISQAIYRIKKDHRKLNIINDILKVVKV